MRSVSERIRRGIQVHGIRNSHLVAVAPTGSISLLANNVARDIESVIARAYERKLKGCSVYLLDSPGDAVLGDACAGS
jgi:ribonucleoside-diphosphate reductase alpha chain